MKLWWLLLLMSSVAYSQPDSTPVGKTLKNKPVPNYPDSNSIFQTPDTAAIYKEQQGYPDTTRKNHYHQKDNIKTKKPTGKKMNIAPADKTKITPKKIKKPSRDTTGTGEKHNL